MQAVGFKFSEWKKLYRFNKGQKIIRIGLVSGDA